MVHVQPVLHTANVLGHIVGCMVNARPALRTPCVKFVQDIQNSLLVRDILPAQYVEHTINVNTVTDIPTAQVHPADVLHLIHIIAIVPTIIK